MQQGFRIAVAAALSIAGSGIALAQSTATKPADPVVAVVNDESIHISDVMQFYKSVPEKNRQQPFQSHLS